MRTVQVAGTAIESFSELPDVFGRLASHLDGVGAALVVRHRGETVARLAVGDYSPESRQIVFSVSKLVLAIALHRVAERGELDLDRDLEHAWPEFGSRGGHGLTIGDVLSHSTTLAALDVRLTAHEVLNGGDTAAILEAASSARRSDTPGYHAVTFGTILEGVAKGSLSVTLAELIRREIAEPLMVDLSLGSRSPVTAIRFADPAEIRMPSPQRTVRDGLLEALTSDPSVFNSPEFTERGLPSMGVIASASALATMMSACLEPTEGVTLLSGASVNEMTRRRSSGVDRVLGIQTAFGAGPQLPFPRLPWTGTRAFGHEGAGGSAAFADPDLGLAVGFTTDTFSAAPGASPILLGMLPSLRLMAASLN